VRGFSLGTGLLIDVERSLIECLVRSFDLLDSVIVSIELISADLVKLAEVLLGLLVLVYDGSYPACGTRDFEDWLGQRGSVGDLELSGGILESEHVDVGGSRYCEEG
jgi:hypothetical protein